MGLFDRFRKKMPESNGEETPEWPKPPREDTMTLLLMDRVLEDIDPALERLREVFGKKSVSGVDRSHPKVPAFIVKVEGLEFWCSYLPMPVPETTQNIPAKVPHNLFLEPEERDAFCAHQSFWLLAQKKGGRTLESKRRVCWAFSLLCAALLELEGAVGVSVANTGLLVSREHYLFQRGQMEGRTWNDPDFFPVTLWIWLYRGLSEKKPTLETQGMREFGLPDLGFFDPEQPIQDVLNYLHTMACFQITGQQLYRDRTLIPLTEEVEVVCKRSGEKLYFIGC